MHVQHDDVSDHLSETLDRADRGLDHAPPDEHRTRPPLDPRGAVRVQFEPRITGFPTAEERRAAQDDAAARAVAHARYSAALGLELGIHYLREAAAYLLAAGESGNHELLEQQLDIIVAIERRLDATIHGAQGNAACNRDLDDSAARPSTASAPASSGDRANVEAPAPTSHTLELDADVADELDCRGGLTAPSTSCSTRTTRRE